MAYPSIPRHCGHRAVDIGCQTPEPTEASRGGLRVHMDRTFCHPTPWGLCLGNCTVALHTEDLCVAQILRN